MSCPRVEFELLVEGFDGIGGEVCFAEVPDAWWKVGNVLGFAVGPAGIGGADSSRWVLGAVLLRSGVPNVVARHGECACPAMSCPTQCRGGPRCAGRTG